MIIKCFICLMIGAAIGFVGAAIGFVGAAMMRANDE